MNLIDTGLTIWIANAMTQGLANSNLMDFFTGRQGGVYKAGADGSYRLTLPELIKGANISPSVGGLQDVLSRNIEKNWMNMAVSVIVAPMAVKMAKKVLRKPVLTPINKLIKQSGLDVRV